ncbi:hypothetical protein Y032_0026g1403 [Ancylostoma ceylanicum]|uniref:Uncharacterized protein n=1 Tax=Ancylostoma ceylanicum TaxID=53326 RepID=A0A016UUG7_9BILA|nr:hypothetical protein Y032_0026g1403 [Ancylostoma ceylanicum]
MPGIFMIHHIDNYFLGKPIMITSRLPSVVACTSRSLSTTAAAWNRYDPRLFRDPITDIKEVRFNFCFFLHSIVACALNTVWLTSKFGCRDTVILQMHQPLDENDERNFLFLKAMKSDDTPVFYRDHTVGSTC